MFSFSMHSAPVFSTFQEEVLVDGMPCFFVLQCFAWVPSHFRAHVLVVWMSHFYNTMHGNCIACYFEVVCVHVVGNVCSVWYP